MSYVFDGKFVGQWTTYNPTEHKISCSKCSKQIVRPEMSSYGTLSGSKGRALSYIGTDFYIYETKSGIPAIYCSKYCRNKHNHRFRNEKSS